MNFPPVILNQNQQGAGLKVRLDQLNLALYTRRTISYEIDTSNDFFFELLNPTSGTTMASYPQGSADTARSSRKVTAAITHR
jgi:hypothetical protein